MSIKKNVWVMSWLAGRLYKKLARADAAFDIALSIWDMSKKKADEASVSATATRLIEAPGPPWRWRRVINVKDIDPVYGPLGLCVNRARIARRAGVIWTRTLPAIRDPGSAGSV